MQTRTRRSAGIPIPMLAAILGFAISVLIGTVRWLPPERILGRSLVSAVVFCGVALAANRWLQWLARAAEQGRACGDAEQNGPEELLTSEQSQPTRADPGSGNAGR